MKVIGGRYKDKLKLYFDNYEEFREWRGQLHIIYQEYRKTSNKFPGEEDPYTSRIAVIDNNIEELINLVSKGNFKDITFIKTCLFQLI